ncbi:hypothetical protein [Thermonema rossianum]|uniref:hypothetical protein n=1 Tax=Thermonema rossianum TaxID=55505 RepID=UPI00057154B1|nr:hypothetical protein [Thermonema rossianum]
MVTSGLRYIKIEGKDVGRVRLVFLGAGQEVGLFGKYLSSMPPHPTYLIEIQKIAPISLFRQLKEITWGSETEIIGLSMGARIALWASIALRPAQLSLIAPEGMPAHPLLYWMLRPQAGFLWDWWHALLPLMRKHRHHIMQFLGAYPPLSSQKLRTLREHWSVAAAFEVSPRALELLTPVPVTIYLPEQDRLIASKKTKRFWKSYRNVEFFFTHETHANALKNQCFNIVYKE